MMLSNIALYFLEINPEAVQKALDYLANAVNSRVLPETTQREVTDCFKKLSKNSICSKEYSYLSKPSIVTIFEGKIELFTRKSLFFSSQLWEI